MEERPVLLIAAFLVASNAAAEAQPGALMLGGSINVDRSDAADELEDALGAGFDVDDDGSAIGPDIYVGYAFAGASSVRLGYRKFGEQAGDVSFAGSRVGDYSVEADGIYFAGDLMLPVSDTFYVGATLGFQGWDGDISTRTTLGASKDSADGGDFFYGLRGKFLFNEKNTGLVLGYTRYSFEDETGEDLEYDSLSIGLEVYLH